MCAVSRGSCKSRGERASTGVNKGPHGHAGHAAFDFTFDKEPLTFAPSTHNISLDATILGVVGIAGGEFLLS